MYVSDHVQSAQLTSLSLSVCVCLCIETLLDDFMLTHPIFLTADRLQQVLLQQYPSHTHILMHNYLDRMCSQRCVVYLHVCMTA